MGHETWSTLELGMLGTLYGSIAVIPVIKRRLCEGAALDRLRRSEEEPEG